MVIHAIDFVRSQNEFCTTELNLFIGRNFLVTYHDEPLRSIATTIDRITKSSASIARAPDRLTYYILELLLENYDPALEKLSTAIAEVEDSLMTASVASTTDVLSRALFLKGQVQKLRQIMAPQREVIARLAHGEFKLVRAHLLPYYRDLQDRLARIADQAENYRDAVNDVMQMHFHIQQSQANRVIKVLTVLATLSIPFVGIASYYGMNFQHIPEFGWRYGPAYMLGLTAILTGIIFWLLKKKRWL
jgi:magnesium transporter